MDESIEVYQQAGELQGAALSNIYRRIKESKLENVIKHLLFRAKEACKDGQLPGYTIKEIKSRASIKGDSVQQMYDALKFSAGMEFPLSTFMEFTQVGKLTDLETVFAQWYRDETGCKVKEGRELFKDAVGDLIDKTRGPNQQRITEATE